jgi:hypothetical protein
VFEYLMLPLGGGRDVIVSDIWEDVVSELCQPFPALKKWLNFGRISRSWRFASSLYMHFIIWSLPRDGMQEVTIGQKFGQGDQAPRISREGRYQE